MTTLANRVATDASNYTKWFKCHFFHDNTNQVKSTSLLVLTLLGSFLLSGCGGGVTLQYPSPKAVFENAPPNQIIVEYDTKPATLPKITLNDNDITDLFNAGDKTATAPLSGFSRFLELDSRNHIHINPPLGPQTYFVYGDPINQLNQLVLQFLNTQGAKFITDVVVPAINVLDLNDPALGLTPDELIERKKGCLLKRNRAGQKIILQELFMDIDGLALDFKTDRINFDAKMTDVRVNTSITQYHCLLPSITVRPRIDVSTFNITGHILIDLDPVTKRPIVNIVRGDTRIGNVDFSRIPDWAEKFFGIRFLTNLIADKLRNTIGDVVIDLMTDKIQTIIDESFPL